MQSSHDLNAVSQPINQNYTRGILLKLLNLVLFCSISLLFSALPSDNNSMHSVFLMMIFSFFSLYSVLVLSKKFGGELHSILKANLFKRNYWFLGILKTIGMATWFKAIQMIGLNETTAVTYMTPLITLLLAKKHLGEKYHRLCLLAVIVSIFGMYIVIRPNLNTAVTSIGSLLAVISAVCWAYFDIVYKL